jgi:superfamily I DNA/RNA helicase
MSFDSPKNNLNKKQQEAVETLEGPLLIIAGAGAGKTKTMTHRILNLIKKGVKPSEILAITFTNKAAKEMRDRVFHLIGEDKILNIPISFNERPFVSTFHALGVHIIKENASLLGLTRNFTIYDRGDSKRAVKEALEELGYDIKQHEPGTILNIISRQKGDGVSLSSYKNGKSDFNHNIVAAVWEKYEATLLKEKSLDFDDLLLKTANLLKTYPEVKKHYNKVWKYIHIDEYQDTNKVQYDIAALLAEENRNICVVGDIDQCLTGDTKISTPAGSKKISEISKGEEIISISGHGDTCTSTVDEVISKKYTGEICLIKTGSGELRLTPNHIVFSRIEMEENSHYVPHGTTNKNTIRSRINLNLKMFDDSRKGILHPWGMTRISINTTDIGLKDKLIAAGFKPRKGKRADWRLEITRLDYAEAEKITNKILSLDRNLILSRSVVVDKKRMYFHPASNIIVGMIVGLFKNGKVQEQRVVEVQKEQYSGMVYDLNIKNVHNYIANTIPVHNCIYSWRGADIGNMINFEKEYPETKIITLEENYRSTQTILTAANNVIKKNVMRPEKNLFTKNVEGDKIELLISYTEQEEARMIADEARELIEAGNDPREMAVLYRANFQSRALEEAFLNKNIPYQVLGVKFFERKEVKDVLSFIKASLNRESTNDLVRVVNVPPRGIGKATIMKVVTGQESTLGPALKNKVALFLGLLERIKITAQKETPSTLIKYIIRESGMENVYKNGGIEEQEKLENLRELVTVASQHDSLPTGEAIEKLLENAALATDQDEMEKDSNAVKLMTVHASKGLEFDYVFVAGMEEDLFPHQRMNQETISQNQAEEERRLFYVAITRARKKIFLSYAQLRTIFGAQKVNTPSSFISDIGDEHIESKGDTEAPRGIKAIFIDF